LATRAGSGASSRTETDAAAEHAAREALASLGGCAPVFGVVFASPRHDLARAIGAVRRAAAGAPVLGCSTAGEITERGLTRGGLSVMLVSSDRMLVDVREARSVAADPRAAAAGLCWGFPAAARAGAERGLRQSTTVALVDGLNGAGERLIAGLLETTSPGQQVVGGAAGDDGAFAATRVGCNGDTDVDAAVVLHAFSERAWGVGVDHGLRPRTERMLVTRASGNRVYEIEGRPAFEVYREFAARAGVSLTRDAASSFMIANELGLYFFDELRKARAPLAVRDDDSLSCAGEIPQGASVCILDGEPDAMIAAATRAAEEARATLAGGRTAGVLLFDCVCRGMILEEEFHREIEAVKSVFPDTPVTGLLTYGEIARFRGRLDGWHNATAVVVAIPA
jgi:hypothetical protein